MARLTEAFWSASSMPGFPPHPVEDAYATGEEVAAVFDGVTLLHYDPYPHPSPAGEAARRGAEAVVAAYEARRPAKLTRTFAASLLGRANTVIRAYNEELGTTPETVDFLRRQYAAAVAAVAIVREGRLVAAQINDSEVRVLDAAGRTIFRLTGEKRAFYEYLLHLRGNGTLEPGSPDEHRYVREWLVNHRDIWLRGRPVRSGVLTGEPVAEQFVATGSFALEPGLTVCVHTDGFTPLFELPAFTALVPRAPRGELEAVVRELEREKPEYAHEKTLIRVRL